MNRKTDRLFDDLRQSKVITQDIDNVRTRIFDDLKNKTFHRGPSRFVWRILIIVMIIVGTLTTTVVLAQESLPENFLYPVKRISENIWLAAQISTDSKLRVGRELIRRRFDEMRQSSGKSFDRYTQEVEAVMSNIDQAVGRDDMDVLVGEVDRLNELLDAQQADFEMLESSEAEADNQAKVGSNP